MIGSDVVSNTSNSEHLSRLLTSLVNHYIQPIHSSTGRNNEDEEKAEEGDADEDPHSWQHRPLPPFLEAVRQQSLQHESSVKDVMQQCLIMYKSHVRKALYAARPCQSKEQRFTRFALPVLHHYVLFIACLITAKEDDRAPAHGEALSYDESILYLANDITAIQSRHAMEEEEVREGEEVRSDTSHIQRTMLRAFLRLMGYMLRETEHIKLETAQRCFISLLAFCAPKSYECMDQQILQRIFDLKPYVNIPIQETMETVVDAADVWRIVTLNDSFAGLKIVEDIDLLSQRLGIEALVLLERLSARQEPQQQSEASSFVQVVHDHNLDELPEHLQTCCRLTRWMGGNNCMASAVRAHFFGRDMLPEDRVAAVPRQRLHLGKTITETPKQECKFHRLNSSRTLVAMAFCRLTTFLTQSILDDLVPIIYDLINDSADKVRWASVVIFHLLKIAPEVWRDNPIVCENLVQMIYKEIQPMRDGPSLVLIGLAQASLFQIMVNDDSHSNESPDSWIHQRRKATQQWLMMLKQNNMSFTKNHLVLGALYGGILPFLHAHANSPTLDGLEMGRLGLQALLPVLQQGLQSDVWMANDDDASPLSSGERALLKRTIHRGTLVALSNLFLAAHPIIGLHQGKILCTLVAFIRTTGTKFYSVNHKLAEDVAAVALHMGKTNKKARDAVVQRILGDYDHEIHQIMAAIQDRGDSFART